MIIITSGGMASILSDVPDILHVQHKVFWAFQREKYNFFQKCSKNGLVAKKMVIPFFGGGVRTQSDKYHFFLTQHLLKECD